ncbi:copper amine oxidase N-terminal domain-containing protein [bacterium]|nr:copper amine oxidase N-terminal domain-containing protein [bacterium]
MALLTNSAFADDYYSDDNVQLVVNDHVIPSSGTIINGCTMVPLRAIVEAMGGQIRTDKAATSIAATIGQSQAEFRLGQREVCIDGRRVLMSQATTRLQGITCIPLRFFADSWGARLDWSNEPKAVYIYSSEFRYSQKPSADGAIKAVFVSPSRALVSGDVMHIIVMGSPASRVTVDIEGVRSDIPAYEDRPGRYLAELPIDDTMHTDSGTITAKLEANGQQQKRIANDRATINIGTHAHTDDHTVSYSPGSNSIIDTKRPNITVRYSGCPLQRDSIHLWFDEQEYTHQLAFRPGFAIWRPSADLPYGKHHVRFTAIDSLGNPLSCEWYFVVSLAHAVISDSEELPRTLLNVFSPRFGDSVGEIFSVVGRATANSNVTITISELEGHERGIRSHRGFSITRTVQADLAGRFEAEFDLSTVRAGHRLRIVAEAENNTITSKPHFLEVVRR